MSTADDEVLATAGRALAERASVVLPGWLVGRVGQVIEAAGRGSDHDLVQSAARAARSAATQAVGALFELAGTDVDHQRTTPLSAVRTAVAGDPTRTLQRRSVPLPSEVPGDVARRRGDPYRLAPGSWAEVDPELAELALAWGAVKAAVHRRRHTR